ncbi:MAG TPA: hypothetical protein VMX58_03985 [Patescibacteria group bacterium]|nr:hypothetical protein [Patescibacteria group bacterium]
MQSPPSSPGTRYNRGYRVFRHADPCNFGFVSALCPDPDTFCVHAWDARGWTITADPPLTTCYLVDPGWL